MEYSYTMIKSPVGELKLVASDKGLAAILWENDDPKRVRLGRMQENAHHPILLETQRQLAEYFAGSRQAFDIPLDFKGTAFQKSVWAALLTIPFGQTRSYKQIAQQVRSPKGFRAVGAANGKNPISIIAPCHRVIAADGGLGGFAGGLDAKTCLLDIESPSKQAKAA